MGLPVEAELFVLEGPNDLFNAQLRRTDALTTQFDEFGGALHVCRQLIDVDVVSVEQLEDFLEFGNCFCIPEFRHVLLLLGLYFPFVFEVALTTLLIVPSTRSVTTSSPDFT